MKKKFALLIAMLACIAGLLFVVAPAQADEDRPGDDPTSEPTDDPRDDETVPPEEEGPETGEALYFNTTNKRCVSFNLRPGFAQTSICASATWQRNANGTGMITKSVAFSMAGNKQVLDSNPAVSILDQHVRGCYTYNYSTEACGWDSNPASQWDNPVNYDLPRSNTTKTGQVNRSQNAAATVYWAHVNVHTNNWDDTELYIGVIFGYKPSVNPGAYNLPRTFCQSPDGYDCSLGQ